MKFKALIPLLLILLLSTNLNNNMAPELYQYKIIKAGEIKPKGWIKKQLESDLTQGYIGEFDKVHHSVTHDVFINQNRLSKRKIGLRKEWWSGEHEGYWKDAVIRMAFLTDNKEYIQKSEQWINDLLKHSDDGYIGIYQDCDKPNCRFNHKRGNGELWATSRILMAMLAYYEFTNDEQVLAASEKAAKLVMLNYSDKNYFREASKGGGISHGIGFFEILEWLYRITGNREYLNFSKKLYADFNKGKVRDDDLQTLNLLDEDRLFHKHGAHIAEGMFVPQFIAELEEDTSYSLAANNALSKLYEHLTPGGAMRCDEWIKGRKGNADERYEYCGITEMISPFNKIISFTGNVKLADYTEIMTFNAGQGARFPVLKALSYLTKDNRKHINHRELIKRESYDAAHVAAVCCVLNGARLMPYYLEGMWMKEPKSNGLVAINLGPNQLNTTIKGVKVTIDENTNYPFSDEIEFVVTSETDVEFPLIIRKPFGASYNIEAPQEAQIHDAKDRIYIQNKWQGKQVIKLKFNFNIERIPQPGSKTVKDTGNYIKRGPLVFSLPLNYKSKTVKEYNNSGFYRYKLTPIDTTSWTLELSSDDNFKTIYHHDSDINTPWDNPYITLKGTLTDKKGNKVNVNLVPLGNTVFRRVTFSLYNQ